MPRYSQLDLAETKWYHVVSRCVRRAYLCGHDHNSGISYEHRRAWVEERIKYLASIFTVDIAAFSIMHNHYHIVVRVDDERIWDMPTEEVIRRWSLLYKGPIIIQRYMQQRQSMSEGELLQVEKLAAEYRTRLCDLSWFMRNLNEYISRRSNAEDNVKGHFWESRYKCQALLDEKALLAAMAYTDLNPVRAAMTEEIEQSDHTSAQQRIHELKACAQEQTAQEHQAAAKPPNASNQSTNTAPADTVAPAPQAPLLPFDPVEASRASIPFAFADYMELLETTGRAVHPHKRGYIPDKIPRILTRLGISLEAFIEHSDHFMERFGNHVGDPATMRELAARRNARYLRGVAKARELFEPAA
jgi:REP element-mobilizing transposase RayT